MSKIIPVLLTLLALLALGCQRDRSADTTGSARTTETTTVTDDDGGTTTERVTVPDAAAPADEAPAAGRDGAGRVFGLPAGWQLAPGGATYSASQTPDQVTIKAAGEHPSAGYETKLFTSPLRIYPPQFLLGRRAPTGPSAQVITPFEATASFRSTDPIRTVTVTDAAGKHQVTVDQAKD